VLPERQLARLVWPCAGFFRVHRLRAWARNGVLEREEVDDKTPWEQDRFRATARTRALLDQGLANVGDAAQLYAGGCLVNDPASPWVRVESDSGWQLALHARP